MYGYCLLDTRKTLSLTDDVITTTDKPPISTNLSYVPTTTDSNYINNTSTYIDINDSYKSALSPIVNTEENPAYKIYNNDYI